MTEHTSTFQPPEVLRLRGIQNNIYHLRAEEIYYIRADSLKCYIMCKGCLYHVRHPMIQLEELMPKGFVRLGRSFILNPNHIIAVYKDCVEFSDYSKLVLSKDKAKRLKEYLGM
ncbi:MAG: LytTR family DNA-binding domain-containing protein, partial [Brotaphodocola sp.]